MKKRKVILPLLGGLATTAFLVAPGKASKEQEEMFRGRNIAHRGLHKIDRSIPENSFTAFCIAAENGYGVELDVRLTDDGRVVVFHDEDTSRLCGVAGKIEDMSWNEVSALRLLGTGEGVPLFSDVLEMISGRVPIIVELKRGKLNNELCERTLELIKQYMNDYAGPVCIESFDPFIVGWFRKKAPDILRGQLTAAAEELKEAIAAPAAFILSNVLTNVISRPQFIAHAIGPKSLPVRMCEAMGAMKAAWTSRDWSAERKNDMVIFEHYLPRTRFK